MGTSTNPVTQYFESKQLSFGAGAASTVITVGGFQIIPQSISVAEGGDLKEYKNAIGKRCAIIVPEQPQTLSISGLLVESTGSATPPAKGSEVTGIPSIRGIKTSGVHWRLKEFSQDYQNEDATKVSFTVESYEF